MTAPATPSAAAPAIQSPVGVPAWVTRLASALIGLVVPVLAWIDPGNKLPPHEAIRWIVILAFALIGAAIFLIHLIHSDVHEYGWNLNAVTHIESDAETEVKQQWPQIKAAYDAAKPALDQLPGFQNAVSTVAGRVDALEKTAASSGLTPDTLIAAFETATGQPWPFPKAPAPATTNPAVTGQTA